MRGSPINVIAVRIAGVDQYGILSNPKYRLIEGLGAVDELSGKRPKEINKKSRIIDKKMEGVRVEHY